MKKSPVYKKSIFLIIFVFIIFIIVNCSQPFSFSGVLDGLTDETGGSGSSNFADIDYVVESITNSPANADVNTLISQSFIFENQGSDPGTYTVYWTAYFSEDDVLDGGDTAASSGSTTDLGALTSSESINITGSWPASAGIYYLIVKVSAGDDIDPSNNYIASSPFTINATGTLIDYKVSNISSDYPTVTSGSLCSETFDLANIGGGDGADDITWTAWASDDITLGGDTEIGSGILSALNTGSSYSSVPISGSWPGTADDYYIIIDISSPNEDITVNNTTYNGPYTVKDPPDYSISSANFLTEGVPGSILSLIPTDYDFVIENEGNNGNQQIGWEVFASEDTILDGGDSSLNDGNIDPLLASGSSGAISFSDSTWPENLGRYYYLIFTINAGDDSNSTNNTYVSSNPVAVPVSYSESNGVSDNSSSGPTTVELSDVSDLFPSSIIGLNDLFKINCKMDANGEFDTYKFIAGSSVTTVDIYAEWTYPGFDPITLHLWDLANKDFESSTPGNSTEPADIPREFGVVSETTNYIGVEFIDPLVVPDTVYTLIFHAKP